MSSSWALESQRGASALMAPPANSQAAQIIHGWAVAKRPTNLNMPGVSRAELRSRPVCKRNMLRLSGVRSAFQAHGTPSVGLAAKAFHTNQAPCKEKGASDTIGGLADQAVGKMRG